MSLRPLPFVAANPISISLSTLVLEVVIFLVMVWLMERLVFNPIRTAWRERNQAIEAGLVASTATRDESEEARREVRRILSEARRDSQKSLDEARAEGELLRAQRVEEATAEFQRLVAEARVQIQAEHARAGAQLKHLVIDLALEAATKVVGQPVAAPEARQVAAAVVSRAGMT